MNHYDQAELVSIKVPANYMAYCHHSVQFENFNGQIEISGVPYNFVKRRIYNDSIEMLCIPNQKMMELQNCENDFLKLVNDLKPLAQNKKSGTHGFDNFGFEFLTNQELFVLERPGSRIRKYILLATTKLPVQPFFDDEHPPDFTA